MSEKKPTLGQAIDQIINALNSLEPDAQQTAIDAACSHLGIQPSSERTHVPVPHVSATSKLTLPRHVTPPPSGGKTPTGTDIRSLKELKQPKSARQMACVVAYYLKELAVDAEKKETISTQDLEKYFKQAGFRLPKVLEQVLRDAKSSGYFESASRGEYRLNAVGYNLVAHSLPK